MRYDITLVSAILHLTDGEAVPLGPFYLAAALKAAGRNAEVIDIQPLADGNLFAWKTLADVLSAAQGDVIGVSLLGSGLPMAVMAVDEYRKRGGTKTIIFGGPGANGVEERLLDRFSGVDVVVRGEGEEVLPRILDALERGETPSGPGVFARGPDGRVQGTPPVRIADLDALPWPDRQAFAHYDVTKAPMVTARGCPFTCSFCDIITMMGRTVGYRSVDDVVREIAAISSTGMDKIHILDDLFTVNRKRVMAFCHALKTAGLTVQWSCTSRIDLLDDALLDTMAEAGCTSLYFGVDAATEDGWKRINKKLGRDQVIATIAKTLKRCNAWASFIWGYPFETFEDFTALIDLAYDLSVMAQSQPHDLWIQMHFLAPEPATPLFAEHGHTVRFGTAIPLAFCTGKPLRSFAGVEGYDACMDLIRSDSTLFAPFHYYPSERLMEKLLVARAFSLDDAKPAGADAVLASLHDVHALSAKVRHIHDHNLKGSSARSWKAFLESRSPAA